MKWTAAGLAVAGGATLAAAILAGLFGALDPVVSWASLLMGVAAGAGTLAACRGLRGEGGPPRGVEALSLAVFAVIAARQFLWLCASDGQSARVLNAYNYGDLPLHWTYIRYLANGAPFWPEDPIFAGARLQYPLGSDLLAALFVEIGVPLPGLLKATGMAASLALLTALWRWGGGFAAAAFALSGGLAASRLSLGGLLAPEDPELPWKNLFLALFVPQRGFLFALPAGLLLLWSWRERLLRSRRGLPTRAEGLLWGVLPLFHVHSFVMVSLAVAIWASCARSLRRLLPSLLWAVGPAFLALFQVTDGFRASRLVWWKPGWMIGAESPLVFLARNFGAILPLAGWGAVAAWKRRDREDLLLLGPGLGLFALLFFVMLAPWEWDNTKAMVWCFLLLLPPLSSLLARQGRAVRGAAIVLVLAPGLPAAIGGLAGRSGLVVFDEEELARVCGALMPLPVTERIATAQAFNHPVALCGHAVVAGYAGHLWSHGLDGTTLARRLGRVMRGEEGWEAEARSLKAGYVFWGEREAEAFRGSRRPWAAPERRLAAGSWGSLYRLP